MHSLFHIFRAQRAFKLCCGCAHSWLNLSKAEVTSYSPQLGKSKGLFFFKHTWWFLSDVNMLIIFIAYNSYLYLCSNMLVKLFHSKHRINLWLLNQLWSTNVAGCLRQYVIITWTLLVLPHAARPITSLYNIKGRRKCHSLPWKVFSWAKNNKQWSGGRMGLD